MLDPFTTTRLQLDKVDTGLVVSQILPPRLVQLVGVVKPEMMGLAPVSIGTIINYITGVRELLADCSIKSIALMKQDGIPALT
jgi:hypothetical protein